MSIGISKLCSPALVALMLFVCRPAVSTQRPLSNVATESHPAGLYTIFSNLGRGRNLYTDNVAWDVAGPRTHVRQWVAMPFTPTADAIVTQISVAVEHSKGMHNSFVLSLNDDNQGLPGKAIHSWIVRNAPKSRTCCALDTVRDEVGFKVSKGTQYWVVAETNAWDAHTRMEWDLSSRHIEDGFAFNYGHGWQAYDAFTSAFAVFGKR